MRITRLEINNFKRIYAVDITPSGSVIIIGGENKAGKSSSLDSIEAGLRGKRFCPSDPIRHGADQAKIRITITPDEEDELERVIIATKIITPTRHYFEVKYEDGSTPAGTPQAIMDDLLGEIAFDFMDFVNLKPKQQEELLKRIVGLDFSKVDMDRQVLYDSRRDLNRDIEKIKGSIALIDVAPDTPDESVNVDELMEKLKKGQVHNRDNEMKRTQLTDVGKEWVTVKALIDDADRRIAELEAEILSFKESRSEFVKEQEAIKVRGEALKVEVDALMEQDLSPIELQISNSNEINIAVRKKQEKGLYQTELKDLTDQSSALTTEIKEIDAKKLSDIASAKFPVEGLGFGDGVVMFKGCPFDQASSAEQIEVSIGIGASLHPKLAVMLIRQGEKITPTTMKNVIAPLAKKHGLQIFTEDCRAGKEATLIIEDGRVKEGGK